MKVIWRVSCKVTCKSLVKEWSCRNGLFRACMQAWLCALYFCIGIFLQRNLLECDLRLESGLSGTQEMTHKLRHVVIVHLCIPSFCYIFMLGLACLLREMARTSLMGGAFRAAPIQQGQGIHSLWPSCVNCWGLMLKTRFFTLALSVQVGSGWNRLAWKILD